MEFKSLLNLNKYEWWENHRKFATIGVFIVLLGAYIRAPIANDYKVKDTCARFFAREMKYQKAQNSLRIKRDIERYCLVYLGLK